MTEILVDADFGHPPERVWRALTDRRLLSEWFMQTDLEPHEGRGFRLMPDDLPGLSGQLDGELIELDAPRRIVMLWRGDQMHCRVVWELEPTPDGCRLRMLHTGFLGVKGSLRRRELKRTYHRLLAERLPPVLDRLAAGGDLLLAAVPAAPPAPREAVPPDVPDVPDVEEPTLRPGWRARLPRIPHHRRGQLLAVAGAIVLAVLTLALISSLGVRPLLPSVDAAPGAGATRPPSPGEIVLPATPTGGPEANAVPEVTQPPVTTQPAPAVVAPQQPVPTVTPPAPPPPPPASVPPPPPRAATFQAAYRTVRLFRSGFLGEITVTNVSAAAANGWEVVVTLRDGDRVTRAQRAVFFRQRGTVVSFVPLKIRRLVPSGKSVTFRFTVFGPGSLRPIDCSVEGQQCSGT